VILNMVSDNDMEIALVDTIREALTTDSRLENLTVMRSEPLPENGSDCPWAGVYKVGTAFPERTLGMGSGYREQRSQFVIAVAASDLTSGEECADELDRVIKGVVAVLLTDQTIRGMCHMLTEMSVRYEGYTKSDDWYMQFGFISFTAVTRVVAS
jgi:hypothetical protein